MTDIKTEAPMWGKGRPPKATITTTPLEGLDIKKERAAAKQREKAAKNVGPKLLVKKIKQGKVAMKYDKSMDIFLENFVNTKGNVTEAAKLTFGEVNPDKARQLGLVYMRRAKDLGRIYLETKGMGYGALLDVAVEKMQASKGTEWWDRIMKIGGYEDFLTKKQEGSKTVNVMSVHKDLTSQYIEGEVEEAVEEEE